MTIKTYDDITDKASKTYTAAELVKAAGDWTAGLDVTLDTLASYLMDEVHIGRGESDVVAEWAMGDAEGTATILWAGAYNSEGIAVVYFDHAGRAGVAWGGGPDWTDAESAEDALERYFGVNGKEMVN
jgi:hypothetical protein